MEVLSYVLLIIIFLLIFIWFYPNNPLRLDKKRSEEKFSICTIQKVKTEQMINRFKTKYILINDLRKHQMLGIDHERSKFKLSGPTFNIDKNVSKEFLFTLDKDNIILDYNTCNEVLVPTRIIVENIEIEGVDEDLGTRTNIHDIMIEKPNEKEELWSRLKVLWTTDKNPPYRFISAIDSEDNLILAIDLKDLVFIHEYDQTAIVEGMMKWELKTLP